MSIHVLITWENIQARLPQISALIENIIYPCNLIFTSGKRRKWKFRPQTFHKLQFPAYFKVRVTQDPHEHFNDFMNKQHMQQAKFYRQNQKVEQEFRNECWREILHGFLRYYLGWYQEDLDIDNTFRSLRVEWSCWERLEKIKEENVFKNFFKHCSKATILEKSIRYR